MKKKLFLLLILCWVSLMSFAQTVTINWVQSCGSGNPSASSPVLSPDGTAVYFTNGAEGKLYAKNAATGDALWSFSVGIATTNPARTTAVVGANGVIYVPVGSISSSNTPAYLYAIDPNGQEKWKYTIGSAASIAYTSSAITKDGDILTGDQGALHLVKASDGTRKAYVAPTSGVAGAIVVSQGNIAYIQSRGAGFNAYNLNSIGEDLVPVHLGNLKIATTEYAAGSPAVDINGNLIAASGTGKIASMSIVNSVLAQNWVYPANNDILNKIEQSGVVIASDGTFYVAGHENKKIYAINANGSLKWEFSTSADAGSVPAIDNQGYIHFGDNDGNYYIIKDEGASATQIHKANLSKDDKTATRIWSSPVIASDGSIYISAAVSLNIYLYKINVTGTTGPAKSDWPMRGGNAQRTGLQKDPSTDTSIQAETDNKFDVFVRRNVLEIQTQQAGILSVMDIMGRIIYHQTLDVKGNILVPINNGSIYIVKLNDNVRKVII